MSSLRDQQKVTDTETYQVSFLRDQVIERETYYDHLKKRTDRYKDTNPPSIFLESRQRDGSTLRIFLNKWTDRLGDGNTHAPIDKILTSKIRPLRKQCG